MGHCDQIIYKITCTTLCYRLCGFFNVIYCRYILSTWSICYHWYLFLAAVLIKMKLNAYLKCNSQTLLILILPILCFIILCNSSNFRWNIINLFRVINGMGKKWQTRLDPRPPESVSDAQTTNWATVSGTNSWTGLTNVDHYIPILPHNWSLPSNIMQHHWLFLLAKVNNLSVPGVCTHQMYRMGDILTDQIGIRTLAS